MADVEAGNLDHPPENLASPPVNNRWNGWPRVGWFAGMIFAYIFGALCFQSSALYHHFHLEKSPVRYGLWWSTCITIWPFGLAIVWGPKLAGAIVARAGFKAKTVAEILSVFGAGLYNYLIIHGREPEIKCTEKVNLGWNTEMVVLSHGNRTEVLWWARLTPILGWVNATFDLAKGVSEDKSMALVDAPAALMLILMAWIFLFASRLMQPVPDLGLPIVFIDMAVHLSILVLLDPLKVYPRLPKALCIMVAISACILIAVRNDLERRDHRRRRRQEEAGEANNRYPPSGGSRVSEDARVVPRTGAAVVDDSDGGNNRGVEAAAGKLPLAIGEPPAAEIVTPPPTRRITRSMSRRQTGSPGQ